MIAYLRTFSAQLSRVNDNGCWLLIASTVVSIKTCLVVIPSYRNDVGPWLGYGTLFCSSVFTSFFLFDWFISLLLITQHLKVSSQTIFHHPVYCLHFHWLVDTSTTFWPLACKKLLIFKILRTFLKYENIISWSANHIAHIFIC